MVSGLMGPHCFPNALNRFPTSMMRRVCAAFAMVHYAGARGAGVAVLLDADTAMTAALSLDVDDDLAAVWLHSAHKSSVPSTVPVRLVALTTTHGNAPAWITCRDAQRLSKELLDFPPIACGGGAYLWGGFDASLPPTASAAADLLVAQTLAALHAPVKSSVVWVAVGALTNVAQALRARPDLASSIELVVMGGSLGGMLELSIAADAAAARFVLALPGLRRVLLPLELGKSVSVTTAHLDELARCVAAAPPDGSRRFIAPHLPLLRRHAVYFGLLNPLLFGPEMDGPSAWERITSAARWHGEFHPWDVLAAAYVTDPGLFGPLQCWAASIADGALTLSAELMPEGCSMNGESGFVGVPESVDAARLAQLLVVRLCAVNAAPVSTPSHNLNGEL
jgi:inosine-uridine nucleoside N-ribohydrolase